MFRNTSNSLAMSVKICNKFHNNIQTEENVPRKRILLLFDYYFVYVFNFYLKFVMQDLIILARNFFMSLSDGTNK